ncbi:dienelactone hydrolase family protein [Phycisphaera mikurensis]|uniref:Peptidase S9 prolyl oligopeptidase catalytic domain-containing protein n=1 Tax=Phycisphaera mikurensis (strain NBRC 102666 / KCTC 22515 / FYK2301M01) TaxID=1142394 RepID=I0IG48_PHYMF|nr:alpha/beta hydrolase [Phycisphaera mikurensis]MBB6440381.1 dienelactone hydrolase [Phycisphaera mikurensis]BAM04236.1 hypothetical protein PSMK_20770 [Phycisphaera mikurensis NBRC 102666]
MRRKHGPRILNLGLGLKLGLGLGLGLAVAACGSASAGTVRAEDTFDAAAEAAADPAHARALRAAGWTPEAFGVEVAGAAPRRTLRFPAPTPGAGRGDRALPVEVLWFGADRGDAAGPAVVIVHSLAPGMPLARGLANAVAQAGVDAFVVTLPGYGGRRPPAGRSPGAEAVLSGAGGVADVRRALDAVAALAEIDGDRLVLAGISLGSFAAVSASALDGRPVATVSFLGGGSAFEGLRDGAKDAAFLREELLRSGETMGSLEARLRPIEPLAFAGRLEPDRVWLATATADQVILPANAAALAAAVGGEGLADDHWIRRPGNHYTAAFALPGVAQLLVRLAEAPPGR